MPAILLQLLQFLLPLLLRLLGVGATVGCGVLAGMNYNVMSAQEGFSAMSSSSAFYVGGPITGAIAALLGTLSIGAVQTESRASAQEWLNFITKLVKFLAENEDFQDIVSDLIKLIGAKSKVGKYLDTALKTARSK